MQRFLKSSAARSASKRRELVAMRRKRRLRLARWLLLLPTAFAPACAHLPDTNLQRSEPTTTASTDELAENALAAATAAAAKASPAPAAPKRSDGSSAPDFGNGDVAQVDYEGPGLVAPVVLDSVPAPPHVEGSPVPSELPPPVAPDGQPHDNRAMSIEELEQIALANNPSIQQAQAVVNKARGIKTQVGLYPNPTIGYLANEMGDDGTAGKQGGFLSQTIVTGGKLELNRAVAEREIQNLLWELEAQRYRVRNAVRTQFYEVLGAQRRAEVAGELVEVAQEGVQASRELVAAGQAARPDLLQARIQLNEVRILLRNARYSLDAAWSQLVSLVGQPDLSVRPLKGTLPQQDGAVRELETALAELLAASPQLQAARARVDRARAQLERQQVQPIPNLIAQVGVAHDNASGDDIANLQLGLPIPVFNRNQGGIQLALAEYRRAVAEIRRLELLLQNRLAAAFRDYRQARNEVQQYRDEILPTAEENLNLTEEGYRQGEFDLIRVLTARRSYFESNLAYINSQVTLRQADVNIAGLLLSGGLDDVLDAPGANLQGIGLRDQALGGQ